MASEAQNQAQTTEETLFGLSRGAIVLLTGVVLEGAIVAIGVWASTWYRLNTALFDASFQAMSVAFMVYLMVLVAVPILIAVFEKKHQFSFIAVFVFTWLGFIFVFLLFNEFPLV